LTAHCATTSEVYELVLWQRQPGELLTTKKIMESKEEGSVGSHAAIIAAYDPLGGSSLAATR
jgi:hypothetical protein